MPDLRLGLNASVVQGKGTVRIPQDALDHLGAKKGDILVFEILDGDGVLIRPAEIRAKVRGNG